MSSPNGVRARVTLIADGASRTVELPVDVKRTYTWLSVEDALALRLRRLGTCHVPGRNGHPTTRALAEVTVEYGGERRPVTVVIAEPGDEPALGATTLDAFPLAVDPRTGELRTVAAILEN